MMFKKRHWQEGKRITWIKSVTFIIYSIVCSTLSSGTSKVFRINNLKLLNGSFSFIVIVFGKNSYPIRMGYRLLLHRDDSFH